MSITSSTGPPLADDPLSLPVATYGTASRRTAKVWVAFVCSSICANGVSTCWRDF